METQTKYKKTTNPKTNTINNNNNENPKFKVNIDDDGDGDDDEQHDDGQLKGRRRGGEEGLTYKKQNCLKKQKKYWKKNQNYILYI